MMEENLVIVEQVGKMGIITLNRPAALNALNKDLLFSLLNAIVALDASPDVTVLVIKGNERAFAAGADIKAMEKCSSSEISKLGFIELFGKIGIQKKPMVAIVNGFALGGGFELALACDMIFASESAIFGLPEITLGVIPGGGGTQRLTRLVGKSIAMDLILNGRKLTALEAHWLGIVSRVFSNEEFEAKCFEVLHELSERAPLALIAAREAIQQTFTTSLADGLAMERNLFYSLFDTADQKEGMKAFLEKRKPKWQGK